MIYIVTALMCEAKPLIDRFNLKRFKWDLPLEVFASDKLALIVSGTGSVNAAIATTSLLTAFHNPAGAQAGPNPSLPSFILNIGTCGLMTDQAAEGSGASFNDAVGRLYAINHIKDLATGRHLYPPMLYKLDLPEAGLVCSPLPVNEADCLTDLMQAPFQLCDMESFGFFLAAEKLVCREHIITLKAVSDYCRPGEVTPALLTAAITQNLDSINRIIDLLIRAKAYERAFKTSSKVLSLISSCKAGYSSFFALSSTEEIKLDQLLHYGFNRGLDAASIADSVFSSLQADHPGMTAQNGKQYSGRFMTRLHQALLPQGSLSNGKVIDTLAAASTDSLTDMLAAASADSLTDMLAAASTDSLIDTPALASAGSPSDMYAPTSADALTDMHAPASADRLADSFTSAAAAVPNNIYNRPFSHIYVEEEALNYPLTRQLLARYEASVHVVVPRYMDFFSSTHRDFTLGKQAQNLILACSHEGHIYPGAPVCQAFGHDHFYYTSGIMNCIYDCEYCYLQGMYPSSDIVIHVNIEDTFRELEELLAKHPVYLCISYDTDLLPLEPLTSFVGRWLEFTAKHPDLTIELRTKSAYPVESLAAQQPSAFEAARDRFIIAYTLSPQPLAKFFEHKTPGLDARLAAANRALEAGLPVRLCFDPVLDVAGGAAIYEEFIDYVFARIPADRIIDASLGSFRISKNYLAAMRKKRPTSQLTTYPYITRDGYCGYSSDTNTGLLEAIRAKLLCYLPKDRLFES